ncbi:phage protein [Yersinia pekkanenii]|uniref:Phage protein n=2 Tax=Yersinia pekkanenii TaxID=1288385 RepID=A0A0T9RSZ1_9GAMM|nr:phage protein [Yersinia pekkanenii]CRY69840.1 phage protein [Yersinia pekkanenii]
MTSYIARVEISGGDANEYALLHEMMRGIGFSKEIVGDEGRVSSLPTGTYVANLDQDIDAVRDNIQRVALQVSDNSPQIVVCSFDRWSGYLMFAS